MMLMLMQLPSIAAIPNILPTNVKIAQSVIVNRKSRAMSSAIYTQWHPPHWDPLENQRRKKSLWKINHCLYLSMTFWTFTGQGDSNQSQKIIRTTFVYIHGTCYFYNFQRYLPGTFQLLPWHCRGVPLHCPVSRQVCFRDPSFASYPRMQRKKHSVL